MGFRAGRLNQVCEPSIALQLFYSNNPHTVHGLKVIKTQIQLVNNIFRTQKPRSKLRARLAQLQLLILSEDLEEPCQTGIF
jgi:hypothetical protein